MLEDRVETFDVTIERVAAPLRARAARARLLSPRRTMEPMLAPHHRSVTWTETSDPWIPYEAVVDGERWELRYPEEAYGPKFRLLIGGRVAQEVREWPDAWSRPIRAFIAGPCPVDLDLYVVTGIATDSPVILYCPDCGCVWPTLDASMSSSDQTLADYGLSEATIRYATEAEVQAAGHTVQERVGIPWCSLPRRDAESPPPTAPAS